MALKHDAAAIKQYLTERNEELAPRLGSRKWWPRFAFHFTDVLNAVGILTEEQLYCRAIATDRGLMKVNNAAPTVIARSQDRTDRLARFYFRPRTPTQYHNEGCRPAGQRSYLNAHCPVPIFFLFDLEALLMQKGTSVSNGTAASDSVLIGESVEFLRSMQWPDIYSSGGMGTRVSDLKFYRMAEIIIQEGVNLEHLKHIVCRTSPERDTLLQLLPPDARQKWRPHVRLSGRSDVFEWNWTYVESVKWVGDTIVVAFSAGSLTPGPFTLTTRVTDVDSGRVLIDDHDSVRTFKPNANWLRINLRSPVNLVHVELKLDGCLVYSAQVRKEGLLTG